jgi:hypothetical protein
MDEQQPRAEDERDDQLTGDGGAADASVTEGVGGMPDLDPEERATVSDVDGDNVEENRPSPG